MPIERYDQFEDPWGHYIRYSLQEYDRRYIRLLKEFKLNPERILEVACGLGYFADILAQEFSNSKIDACDCSERAIAVACRDYGKSAQFYIDNLPDLTNASGTYDLVVANEVLNYLNPLERERAILRIWELLKPGGTFFLTVNIGPSYFTESGVRDLLGTRFTVQTSQRNYAKLNHVICESRMLNLYQRAETALSKSKQPMQLFRLVSWISRMILGSGLIFVFLQGVGRLTGNWAVTNLYLVARKNA